MSIVQARVCSGCAPTVIVLDRVATDSGAPATDEDKMFALFSRFMATMSGNSLSGRDSTSAAPSESTLSEGAGSSSTTRMCVGKSIPTLYNLDLFTTNLHLKLLFDIVGDDDIQTEIADAIQTEMETQEQKGSTSNSDTESEASDVGLKDKVSVHAHLPNWCWCV